MSEKIDNNTSINFKGAHAYNKAANTKKSVKMPPPEGEGQEKSLPKDNIGVYGRAALKIGPSFKGKLSREMIDDVKYLKDYPEKVHLYNSIVDHYINTGKSYSKALNKAQMCIDALS